MRDRTAIWLAGIVLLGLTLRLLPVAFYGDHPNLFLDSDSRGYHRIACNLVAGNGYSWDQQAPYTPNLYRPPGLTGLLAGLYSLTGPSIVAAILLQCLVAALTILLTFQLARELTGQVHVALIAASVLALDPVGIVYCNLLLTEVYTTFVVVLFALALLRYARSDDPRWLFAAGGVLALGIVIHPVLLFLPLVLPFFAAARNIRQIGYGLTAMAFALAPATAWIVRNRVVGDFTGISSVTAVNMLKYKAAGVEAELRGTSREVERDRLTAECEARLPANATPGERFRHWQSRGVEILLAHPLTYAKVHAKGMVVELFGPDRDHVTRMIYGPRVLDAAGVYTDANIAAARTEHSSAMLDAMRLAILAVQGGLAVLMLVGVYRLVRERRWGLMVVLLALPAYVLLLSGGPEAAPRFRVIYLPMLALLTAVAMTGLRKSESATAVARRAA